MSKLEELIQQYCPDGVEYVKLGEICNIKGRIGFRGYTRDDQVKEGEGALSLSPSNIQDGQMDYTKGTYITWAKYDESPEIMTFNGDIIFCKTASVGKVALVKDLPYKATINPQLVVLKDIQCNAGFLTYVLGSDTVQKKVISIAGIGSVPNVSQKALSELEIPIPPLPVQEEIVRVLDTFSELQAELQAELQKRLQQYNYYRDNLLSFDGRTDVEWKRLGDVCLKTDNIKWKSTKETYQYIDLTSVDIQTHNILSTMEIDSSSAPSRAQQIVKEDDVIFATTRPTQMRVCLVPVEYDGQICSTGYCVLRPDSSIVLPQYLFFVLAVESFKTYLLNNQTMGNYPSISNNTLKDYTIPIPSISEQRKIVGVLDRFDTLTCDLVAGLPAEIEKRRQQYEFYRDKLLTFKREEA